MDGGAPLDDVNSAMIPVPEQASTVDNNAILIASKLQKQKLGCKTTSESKQF
jgi:hypothetical protein